METAEAKYCYIGIEKCGCVTSACVDDEKYKKEIAESISKWVKEGKTIERILVTDAMNKLTLCKHGN